MIGIYCIENKINNKKYVGQSNDIKNRWLRHRESLNRNNHSNKHLQGAWNKYGASIFMFYVLEETSTDMLDEREIYWIKNLDCVKNGYNLNDGGAGISGYKHTEEEINKMRRIQNPEIILQFDKDMNFVKQWIGGISHISKELGATKECISLRCNHTIKEMSDYMNSYWVYENEFIMEDFSWKDYMNNIRKYIPIKSSKKIRSKICQYTKERVFVKEWENLGDISAAGYNRQAVCSILNHYKNKKTHDGYIWCYKGYDFSDGYFDKKVNTATEKRKKKIAKLSSSFRIIMTYESLTQAVNQNPDMSLYGIRKAVRSNLEIKYGGYYWDYVS